MAKRLIAVLLIIGFVAAAALSVYFFFFYIDGYSRVLGAQPGAKFDYIKGFSVDMAQFPVEKKEKEQLEYINSAIDFADESGFNAVVLEIQNGDYSLFSSNFYKPVSQKGENAIRIFAEQCREKGLAFYVSLNPAGCIFADNTDIHNDIKRICRASSVTGVIFKASCENFSAFTPRYSSLLGCVPSDMQAVLCLDYKSDFQYADSLSALSRRPEYVFIDFSAEKAVADISAITDALASSGFKSAVILGENNAEIASSLVLAAQSENFHGAVFNGYADGKLSFAARLLYTCLNKPEGREAPSFLPTFADTLTVTLPLDGEVTYSAEYYISGFCKEGLPLYMNGEDITDKVSGTNFGVFTSLEIGENTFTFTQPDGGSDSVTVIREKYTSSGGSTGRDSTKKASAGQAVKVTNWMASVLSDPDSDASIVETLHSGDVLIVDKTVTTVRNGKYTYAYRLADGNYILASAVEFCSDEEAYSSFVGNESSFENGCEYLRFSGSGAPYIRTELTATDLYLTFYNTDSLTADFSSGGTLFSSATVTDNGGGVFTLDISLKEEDPLWGYQIEKNENGFSVCLKAAPALSQNFNAPLSGVTVMVDAGHGGTDTGAMGIGGGIGLTEKVFNLAVANAIEYRLEQLGATVIMTRTDDTFPTLEDRSRMVFEAKPDFFLSVHHNSLAASSNASSVERLECYYAYPSSEGFAYSLMRNISAATGRNATSPQLGYYYVTRNLIAPSVLFEFGYLVSPEEYADCADNEKIWASACAAAQSVVDCIAGIS